VDLLLDYAKSPDSCLAGPAIECLGKLKSKEAVGGLASILERSKDPECLLACCRALGQIADPASIEPLAHMLLFKRFRLWRRRKNPEVRAAAAYALGQIAHPRAAEILASYGDDLDPRVRDVVLARRAGPRHVAQVKSKNLVQ
jgi:HEAT repeat protein